MHTSQKGIAQLLILIIIAIAIVAGLVIYTSNNDVPRTYSELGYFGNNLNGNRYTLGLPDECKEFHDPNNRGNDRLKIACRTEDFEVILLPEAQGKYFDSLEHKRVIEGKTKATGYTWHYKLYIYNNIYTNNENAVAGYYEMTDPSTSYKYLVHINSDNFNQKMPRYLNRIVKTAKIIDENKNPYPVNPNFIHYTEKANYNGNDKYILLVNEYFNQFVFLSENEEGVGARKIYGREAEVASLIDELYIHDKYVIIPYAGGDANDILIFDLDGNLITSGIRQNPELKSWIVSYDGNVNLDEGTIKVNLFGIDSSTAEAEIYLSNGKVVPGTYKIY